MDKAKVTALILVVLGLVIFSWVSPGTVIPLDRPTTSASLSILPTPERDSWILIDLPPNATQVEYGAEVYRLVCKACHGDKGQGLTDEWRAQWAPADQNCWQSKCHATNHSPEGFYMPRAPAIIGLPLQMFETALDLHTYIHTAMPWYDPGSLTERDSWSVTAYILKLNHVDPGPHLDQKTAAKILLSRERGFVSNPDHQVEIEPKLSLFWEVAVFAAIGLICASSVFLIRRILASRRE